MIQLIQTSNNSSMSKRFLEETLQLNQCALAVADFVFSCGAHFGVCHATSLVRLEDWIPTCVGYAGKLKF